MKPTNSITLIVFFLLAILSINAQSEECGFTYTSANQKFFNRNKELIKSYENDFLNNSLASRNSTVLSDVPIKAHIINTSFGTGGLTETELNQAISIMNSIYVDAGIQFFLCDGINYINDDDYYDFETADESALTSVNNLNGVINIYFTNSVTSSSFGSGLCGYAYFPGGPETILMANNCATNGSTLSHEMGHFFALSHTHGNSNVVGSTEELVDGSNCESTGDFICDTPADPQLGYSNVNFSCQYTGNVQDANLDFYQPDPTNLMSYSRKECRTYFSPQQNARIYAIYQFYRSDLACPSFSTDFIADTTESCGTNLTVNFTDNSVGATSWNWDVDGDDIIDYTTQNPTHTYNSDGAYDVVLTVSNGSESISKVKESYIEVGAEGINTSTITLSLTLDDWPDETSWQFVDGDENILYSGGPYIDGVDDFTTISEVFNTTDNQCYSFIITDSYGDGICCFSGDGFYELRDDSNELLAFGGNYGYGNTDSFFNATLSIDKFNFQNIKLYPNPSSNQITIEAETLPEAYSIYNTLGQIIKEQSISSQKDLNDINIQDLKSGLYFIKLESNGTSKVLSFVKK